MTRPHCIAELASWRASIDAAGEAVVDGERRLTWAQLAERTNRVANALAAEFGVARGDRVAYVGATRLEGFELCHAVPRLGALLVPLNERLAVNELTRIIRAIEPKALVHDQAHAEVAQHIADACDVPRIGIDVDALTRYDDLVDVGDARDPGVRVSPDDVSSICFTSGTTGAPKGVLMRHGAQIEFARVQTEIEPIMPEARHLFVRQMSVAPGHRMAAWHGLNGGTTVLVPRFSPSAFFSTVEAERATNVLLAPTMLRMLVDDGNRAGCDISSLRTIVYGGAPMPSDLLGDVLAFFPCSLVQGYGSTEAGQVLYQSDGDHRGGRLGSYGRPVPGAQIRLRDDAGDQVAEGVVGSLHVRSKQLMAGYWRDPGKTAAVLCDGWYDTGDLAVRESDGTYHLVGRASDMIISGGYNVMPSEVEQVLVGHPAVREAVVVGRPDRTWGEAVHAAVVLHRGATVSAEVLIERCRDALGSFKKPRSVEFLDALPLTRAGKIDRSALVRRVSADDPA